MAVKNLYNFSLAKQDYTTGYSTNSDGAQLDATLFLSGNRLYGTTGIGGIYGLGTVYAINTDGSGFTNLHNFTPTQQDPVSNHYTNYDGTGPLAGVVMSNGILYGVTSIGGASGYGIVFALNIDGSGFTNLHNFPYTTGAYPYGALTLSSNTLYGTTSLGGSGGSGTVFSLGIDGSNYTNIYNFTNPYNAQPYGNLILSGGVLYGTTTKGGYNGGTVFRVNTDGSGFSNIVKFQSQNGSTPYGGLVLSGNTLFGTTELGGTNTTQWGTIFSVNTDGSGFNLLHSFNHSDGAEPYNGLFLSGNTLYGTTYEAGLGAGTVFKINTDGSSFSNLYNFSLTDYDTTLKASTNSDGAAPKTGVIVSGGKLYGTALAGGTGGSGVIFELILNSTPAPIPLNIVRSGGNVVLSWSDPSFQLYSAQTAAGPFAIIPSATSPSTNPISGLQQYFRLQAAP